MKNNSGTVIEYRQLSTPRSAAVAGILFGLLFGTSLVLMRSVIPSANSTDLSWAKTGATKINVALLLMPFACIAYLWFIGVVRDKLGEFEDKFFSTVFFGSSLLFLAMVFVSMAVAGGLLITFSMITGETPDYSVMFFGRALMLHINNIYALRMAGVTMISLGTIWLRTGLMPRWLAFVTYLLALVLLVVVNYSSWITLLFPAWVLMISMFILWLRYAHPNEQILRPN